MKTHAYRIALVTVRYLKGGKSVHTEYEVTTDFTDSKLFCEVLDAKRRLGFGETASKLSAFLTQPAQRMESALGCTDFRMNLHIDADGISRTYMRDRHKLLTLLSMAYGRIEEATLETRGQTTV